MKISKRIVSIMLCSIVIVLTTFSFHLDQFYNDSFVQSFSSLNQYTWMYLLLIGCLNGLLFELYHLLKVFILTINAKYFMNYALVQKICSIGSCLLIIGLMLFIDIEVVLMMNILLSSIVYFLYELYVLLNDLRLKNKK